MAPPPLNQETTGREISPPMRQVPPPPNPTLLRMVHHQQQIPMMAPMMAMNPMAAAMFHAQDQQQQQHNLQMKMLQQQGMSMHNMTQPQHQNNDNIQQQQKQLQPQPQPAAQQNKKRHRKAPPKQKKAPKRNAPIQAVAAAGQPQNNGQETTIRKPPKHTPKHLNKEERRHCFQKLWNLRRVTMEEPTVKSLPNGSFSNLGKEFGISQRTVSQLWKRTHERLEQAGIHTTKSNDTNGILDDGELQQYLVDHQSTLFASDHVDGKRGPGPKWDSAILRQAIMAIPLAEQRSVRSLSVALDVSANTLCRFIDKEGIFEELKEQRKIMSHKDAKKLLAQEARDKKRKLRDEGNNEDEERPKVNFRDPKTRKQAVLETTRLSALICDHARCAECGEGPLELTFVTTNVISTANEYKITNSTLPVVVPKLECRGCQFMAFPGNTVTSKTISTPRYAGGPFGANSVNKHHSKNGTKYGGATKGASKDTNTDWVAEAVAGDGADSDENNLI